METASLSARCALFPLAYLRSWSPRALPLLCAFFPNPILMAGPHPQTPLCFVLDSLKTTYYKKPVRDMSTEWTPGKVLRVSDWV